MKIITQKEFENFEVVDGMKQCPTGDYSNITSFAVGCCFAKRCYFAEGCYFAQRCSFAEGCRFEQGCSFSQGCRFAQGCSFSELCSFAEGCRFEQGCRFGEECGFAEWCRFGEECVFAERCRFADCCSFGGNTTIESNYDLICMKKIDGIGSRNDCTYFFHTKQGIIVRCGCFLGNIYEFENRVKQKYEVKHIHYREYIGAIQYIKSILEGVK